MNHIVVNGKKGKKMGMGNKYIQMVISIKVIGYLTLEKEMEFIHFQMGQFIQVNLKIIKLMVKENIHIKMEIYMMENL